MKVILGKYNKTGSERKVKVDIDNFDTWSLDHSLAHIILPALLQLRASKMGVPASFADAGGADYESQDSFDFYKEDHNWAFDQKVKEWELVIDKMIWSFQQIVLEDYEQLYHHGEADFSWEKTDQPFTNTMTGKSEDTFRMVDKNPEDHWYDVQGHLEHEKRVQEGLELFGKYYRHLWD